MRFVTMKVLHEGLASRNSRDTCVAVNVHVPSSVMIRAQFMKGRSLQVNKNFLLKDFTLNFLKHDQ